MKKSEKKEGKEEKKRLPWRKAVMLEVGLVAIITGRSQLAPLAYTRITTITTSTKDKRERKESD